MTAATDATDGTKEPLGGPPRVVIIGGGPAGLTAALLLSDAGIRSLVLEADPVHVGGISRTAQHHGYHFDIGGHRFFSKAREVEDFWSRVLPNDMLKRPRKSRIYYQKKFFSYPLRPVEALVRLGVFESTHCMLSFARARAFPTASPTNLEDWVTNQFGRRLYEIFFKHYTEKVWGMSCREISADWAAQRIKSLNLGAAVIEALRPKALRRRDKTQVHTTLIDEFRYPRKGPGMLWEECARMVEAAGSEVRRGARATGARYDASAPTDRRWVVRFDADGTSHEVACEHVISTMAIRDLVSSLEPAPPEAMRRAAGDLKYRDFLTVALMLRASDSFDDNWIYIQDAAVKVGRIQNFKSWSPEMVPDPSMACYGLEYFCFEGDGLWTSTDSDLIDLAKRELESLGLGKARDVKDGCVVRQPKAYPVYDDAYAANVDAVRIGVEANYPGLHLVGRNGMHRYNNQDHSMVTAMLTVQNIIAGRVVRDPWRVNQDAEYHEAGKAGDERIAETGGRQIPRRV